MRGLVLALGLLGCQSPEPQDCASEVCEGSPEDAHPDALGAARVDAGGVDAGAPGPKMSDAAPLSACGRLDGCCGSLAGPSKRSCTAVAGTKDEKRCESVLASLGTCR